MYINICRQCMSVCMSIFFMYVDIYVYRQRSIHTSKYACSYICRQPAMLDGLMKSDCGMHAYIHVCLKTYIQVWFSGNTKTPENMKIPVKPKPGNPKIMKPCIFAGSHVCMYECMHRCMYVCMCMSAFRHISSMYTYIYIYIFGLTCM